MVPEAGKKESASAIPAEMAEMVDEYKNLMIEAAAEGNDEVTEKYLEEGTLSAEDIRKGLVSGIRDNKIVPVLCGSALLGSGIVSLANFIETVLPSTGRNG
jgi:elongation factor G